MTHIWNLCLVYVWHVMQNLREALGMPWMANMCGAAGIHGNPTLLVSLVQHQRGYVLAQTRFPAHQHESAGVRHMLMGQDLRGKVITLDAGLTHPLATQILEQGGHYLMVVKRNQHQLYEELT